MKKTLLLVLCLITGTAALAQRPRIREGIMYQMFSREQPVVQEPVKKTGVLPFAVARHHVNKGAPGAVTVLDLGTSANVFGYSRGTRTMLWADNNLNVVMNLHRLGPGATPPALSGYLGMDLGLNRGMTQSDWTTQTEVSAATLAATPEYYDASRYPSGGIYNPPGNTSLANAFLAWFAPNYANQVAGGLGGYGYGTANLANPADTTKHIRWYNAHPCTYIPDGFTIAANGIAHLVDIEYNTESGTPVYQDSIVYGHGIWNTATHAFDYYFQTIPFPCKSGMGITDCKVAASPDGNTLWISVLCDATNGTPLLDSTFFPVLCRSVDGGQTWEAPINIQLDGPNGLEGIKNAYSDYFISQLFNPPLPSRDEIPYSTVFDHSLTVDRFGNPHIGVAVGYTTGHYQVIAGIDSLLNVYDIFTCDDGVTWAATRLGSLKTFRGIWGNAACDNRVYVSRDPAGERFFFTWNDTRIDGEVNNQHPDVYARGFDWCNSGMLSSVNGQDAPANVTLLTGIHEEAFWQCMAPTVFTDGDQYSLPICTQWFSDPAGEARFKYISGFHFSDSDFTIGLYPSPCWWWPSCWVHTPDPGGVDSFSVSVSPNPASEKATLSLDLPEPARVSVVVLSLTGKTMISADQGIPGRGRSSAELDIRRLLPGFYFVRLSAGERICTRKLVVE